MKKVYICSPYRAKDSTELDRHIDYAQARTRQALQAGLAPITPHLYMTQCLDEDKQGEREVGLEAGLALLESCDFVLAGVRYGISKGMSREIQTADKLHIAVVNSDKLQYYIDYCKNYYQEYCKDNGKEYSAAFAEKTANKAAFEYVMKQEKI